ncbi:MAG TPA: isoprenylcysteine carboxylmethyltransferase family protein [Pyrinomonadaceae bacterium]|nr:isoprenylcysteine carboxylmethyltransferase family protein [Pyrinomonadaceae bacterium]
MSYPLAAITLRLLWLAAEGAHAMRRGEAGAREWSRIWAAWSPARRRRAAAAGEWERGSGLAWDVASLGGALGVALWCAGVGGMRAGREWAGPVGLSLMAAGLAARWTAIRTLGRHFERVINVRPDQVLVRRGLYGWVRHPSYTGALLAHLGFGLSFANWLALAATFAPMLAAALYRVSVEERALRHRFGAEYDEYAARTKRLLPKLY